MANGIPSSRRQISTTASASSGWASENPEATLWARSTNKVHCGRVDSRADVQRRDTGHNCSSATPNPSRLVARIVTVAECGEDRLDQIGGSVEHVLAVVEHQQPDSALQRGGHRLGHALARLLGDAQHRRDRVGHRRGIGDRGQLEKPDTIRKFIGQPCRRPRAPAGSCRPRPPRSTSTTDEPSPRLAARRPRTRAR